MNSETSATARSNAVASVQPEAVKAHEDRRRPLALRPYQFLWACCVSCVVFALISLFIGL